jgi:hypothetical protein
MKWQWITPDSITVDLMADPFLLMGEVSGHLVPPFKREERWIGEVGMLTGIRADAREIFLPLLVKADDIYSALRLCARYWNPRSGDGVLRVTDDSGKARILKCRYAGGLEGNMRESGPGWQKVGLRLRALQPYWQDEQYQDYVFVLDSPVLFFQSPFFPLRISKGTIDGSVTVNNPGEVEAYPIITVTGPMSSIEVQNVTTGKTMNLPILSMTASDVLVIDTRPEILSIKLNGNNAFGLLSAGSSLWNIRPGNNQLKIVTAGTSSNSSVTISFAARYLTV